MIRIVPFLPGDLPVPSPRAALLEWLAGEGEWIETGRELCRYEVDKAVCRFFSPIDGWLRRRLAEVGARISRGDAIALFSDQADDPLSEVAAPPRSDAGDGFDWSEIDNLAGDPVPLGVMRRAIADRMIMSKRHIPCFYLTVAVDMSGCIALRNGMRRTGRKATFNDMAIKAAALALVKHPKVAAIYLPDGVAPRTELNIGFAAALPDEGLVVPVVKRADQKTLLDIAGETRELSAKAKRGELTPADCGGAVFSVSYLGANEVDNFIAIVNPGEAAIAAVGKTVETPVAIDGRVEIRPMAKITLSSDHRSIDGALAARFMDEMKHLLEHPEAL